MSQYPAATRQVRHHLGRKGNTWIPAGLRKKPKTQQKKPKKMHTQITVCLGVSGSLSDEFLPNSTNSKRLFLILEPAAVIKHIPFSLTPKMWPLPRPKIQNS